jgi:hypothetical protein
MAQLISELEERLVEYVKLRIPEGEWETLSTSGAVLSRLDEEGEDELRHYFWNELIALVKWSNVLWDIQRMSENVMKVESDDDEDEDDEEEEEDSQSTKSDVSCFSSR